MYARVFQVLGNRNVLAFCNDNKIRLCHIRGSIRKDMWISIGDIVLISLRDFLPDKDNASSSTGADKFEKGDILFKYDRDFHSKLRKENNINIKLFLNLESLGVDGVKAICSKTIEMNDDDNMFEDGKEDSEEDAESEKSIDVDNI